MASKGESTVNREAIFGLLPVTPKEREFTFYDFANVNVGLAIATWCFLIGGTMAFFVNLTDGLLAALLGNTVAVIIMAAATTLPSCKYGLEQYTALRSVFGTLGTKVVFLVVVLIVEFLWAAILAVMFGKAMQNVYVGLTGSTEAGQVLLIGFAVLAILVSWFVVWKGPATIRSLNKIIAPGLAIMMGIMIYLMVREFGAGGLLAAPPLDPHPNRWWNFMIAFELNLGAGFSWWPIMGGLARLTKNERAAFWPNMIGINLAAVVGTMVGLAAAITIGTSDPTQWMIPLGGAIFGILALVFVAFANVTSIMSLAYATCLAMKQVKAFLLMDWGKLTAVFFLPAAAIVFFPNTVYEGFGSFLAVCATFFGPLSGIYFVDYFLLRKQRLSLRNIYDLSPQSGYYFWGGINWVAVVAFVTSIWVYYLFLDPITFESSDMFLHFTASLPSTAYAMLAYYVVMKAVAVPKNVGFYLTQGR
ncbi:MAG: cytosine permease [Bacillota bacterium]